MKDNDNQIDDDIARFISGCMPERERIAFQQKLLVDPELKLKCAWLRQLTFDVVGELEPIKTPRDTKVFKGTKLSTVAISAGLLALIGIGISGAFVGFRYAQLVSNLEYSNAGIDSTATLIAYRKAQQIIESASDTTASNPAIRSVSFIRSSVDVEPKNDVEPTVHVLIKNDYLPCMINWRANGSSVSHQISMGDTKLELPAGSIRLECKPRHTIQWHQAYTVTQNGNRLGTSLGPLIWEVVPHDEIVIRIEQPIAPWNAILMQVDREYMIVTIERPNSALESREFLAGERLGPEAFPNTPWFYASIGSKGMAKELAGYVIANRNDPSRQGRFRGLMHTSITVADFDGLPSKHILSISEEQLEEVLENAFEILKQHRPSIGLSIQEEIALAQEMLASHPSKEIH